MIFFYIIEDKLTMKRHFKRNFSPKTIRITIKIAFIFILKILKLLDGKVLKRHKNDVLLKIRLIIPSKYCEINSFRHKCRNVSVFNTKSELQTSVVYTIN